MEDKFQRESQRVGVLIDVQNMYYSARNLFSRKVNFGNVVKGAVGKRQLVRAIAYVVSTKTGENRPFFEALNNIGIETKEKELMEYLSGHKKADWDVGITVDAIKLAENLDVIILVSGDGDYIPLVQYLQSKEKVVEIVSFRETTSSRLQELVGDQNYLNLSTDKRKYLIHEPRHRRDTPRTTKPEEESSKAEETPAQVAAPVLNTKRAASRLKTPVRKRAAKKRTPAREHEDFLSPNERFNLD